jgi:hypothetical protein
VSTAPVRPGLAAWLLVMLAIPVGAAAQAPQERAGWWFAPSVRTAAVYQDQVLLADDSHDRGEFVRVTTTLEASYRVPKRAFQMLYAVDSEKYRRPLQVLDDLTAQQNFGARYDWRPLGLTADARYLTTTRPEEVLENTGLVAAYRKTTAGGGGLSLTRSLSPRLRMNGRYAVSFTDYGRPTVSRPTATNLQHEFAASVTLQRQPRTLMALEYSTRLLTGEDRTVRSVASGTFWDGYLAVRVTRNITPRLRITGLAGPRLAQSLPQVLRPIGFTPLDWKLTPELLGSITYRDTVRSIDVSYARSAFLGFGATGFIDTQRVEARVGYTVQRRLRLSARPAAYRNSLSGLPARSYRFDGGASYDITRWLAIDGAYLYKYQDRALSLIDFGTRAAGKAKTRTTIMFGLTVSRPVRVS